MPKGDGLKLTCREREVLDLIRVGLTNDEIGEHLGITRDGAKYHVSQILSKLGVDSREAASLTLEHRRRWWEGWLVWMRFATAVTAVVALAGLALLAWGTLAAGGPDREGPVVRELTPEELYSRVRGAITRPGFVLHTTLTGRQRAEDGKLGADLTYSFDYWIDPVNEIVRYEARSLEDASAEATVSISVGGYAYTRESDGVVRRVTNEEGGDFCPGSRDAYVSLLLWCPGSGEDRPDGGLDTRVKAGQDYDGNIAVKLVIEERFLTEMGGFDLPRVTNGPQPTRVPATEVETRNVSTTYVAADTFLPMARVYEIRQDGEFHDAFEYTYEHEFLALDEFPPDFFDPASIGYVGEN